VRVVIGYEGRVPVYRDEGPGMANTERHSGEIVRGDSPFDIEKRKQREAMARLRASRRRQLEVTGDV
jgi:hypothetical protein